MKVLLVNPKIIGRKPVYFPLGLGYIASMLKTRGHEVRVLDMFGLGLSDEEASKRLLSEKYDVLGVTGLTTQYRQIKWIAQAYKEKFPATKIIAGGACASTMPEFLLRHTAVDVALINEGEYAVCELLDKLDNGGLNDVGGIVFKNNEEIVRTKNRERIQDFQDIPYPAWDLFPMETYLKNPFDRHYENLRSMNMITSRGCPFNCVFCSRVFGRKFIPRSIDSVIREMRVLKERYGVEYINLADEVLAINKERIFELCQKLIDSGLDIKWQGRSRVDMIDAEQMKVLKRAGCVNWSFGVESADTAILKNLNKELSLDKAKENLRNCKKMGFYFSSTFICGMYGETKKTFAKTVSLIKEVDINPSDYSVFFIIPFPGSLLYERAKKDGLIKDEEKYLESLGNAYEKPYVNLTRMSDEQLYNLKISGQRNIYWSYLFRHGRFIYIFKKILRYIGERGKGKFFKGS